MAHRDVFPIINCRDILAAREFYRTVFGGTQQYQFPEDGEPVFLTLKVGTGTVGLGVGTGPAMYGEVPLPATGHAIDLCLYVDDLDVVIAAVDRRGGDVPVRPRDMPWGERVAYVRDTEGTMLLAIQGE
ncbi:VOC family protein [Pyxidicoccus sp. 3LG]